MPGKATNAAIAITAAKVAARVEDWGTARNRARSVLLARPSDFEAYRIWFQALAHMGEPRTYLVAAGLFANPRSSREDRMDALKVLAQQASSLYDTPSERLKKSPIMNILTKTVTTYMFLKNMNNPREVNKILKKQ